MKKILVLFFVFQFTSCDVLQQLATNAGGIGSTPLSIGEIANGLKEALSNGVNNGTTRLSAVDGFFKNAAVKILLPPEAQNVAAKLNEIGLGSLTDAAVEKLNRAAEDAAKSAAPIFINAIKQMTFEDAKAILMGEKNAATNFLVRTTKSALFSAFQPTIKNSLNKVGAVTAWNSVFSKYNAIPFVTKVNPNLDQNGSR
jgi:Protein of unknown function (DUF4197)